ncbi:salivary peroxidase/catechol oxidase-like [Apostichopus japonicus]|uniref:salivary peroxidase/catechol oxidase-like n=1 Tax=Stichopus japonicus TaxID=307972 RepID=UPI003AB8B53E
MKPLHLIRITVVPVMVLIGCIGMTSGELMDSEYGCPMARSPYKVLAAFSRDEHSVHSIHKRQIAESRTALVHDIEALFTCPDPDLEELAAKLQAYNSIVDFRNSNIKCNESSPFRTINGECNNLMNPALGRSNTPFIRLIKANYADGVSKPREFSKTAREVSDEFVCTDSRLSKFDVTELLVHMGQFIDHDLALITTLDVGCTCEEQEGCLPIPCKPDDEVCGTRQCIRFERSVPVLSPNVDCRRRGDDLDLSRTTMNGITSFLDGSNIYGSTDERASLLRTNNNGLMLTEKLSADRIQLLPSDDGNEECEAVNNQKPCGRAGDIRAAEQPVLTALHTIFVNEHNRIARELSQINPGWDDERLYQEARKIVGGILQNIVYREWLIPVLNKDIVDKYRINILEGYAGYNATIDPSISIDFATAFFRFGHSLVPQNLKRLSRKFKGVQGVQLSNAFFNGKILRDIERGSVLSIINGALNQRLQAVDSHFSKSVHLELFQNSTFALDLIALNIQRGRDHGLPSYLDYRKFFGLSDVKSFEDLKAISRPEDVEVFKTVYSSVEEIEPFVGMLAENHLPGALVGETLANALGLQFHNLRYGDRFYFENAEKPQAFTNAQIDAIGHVLFSRVICNNIQILRIQPWVFRMKTDASLDRRLISIRPPLGLTWNSVAIDNRRVSCDDFDKIPMLDLTPWTENADILG